MLALTVAGFVLTTAVGLAPAWAALAGCLALGGRQLARRRITPLRLVASASPGFCAFVLCLGVLVAGLLDRGAGRQLRHLIPSGTGLLALLGLALLAGLLANLVNNLPTTLALVPLVAGSPLAVLAVLVGVNLGPNASYPGSLATLLWRRSLPPADRPRAVEFHRLGLLATPVLICAVTVLLWLVAGPLGIADGPAATAWRTPPDDPSGQQPARWPVSLKDRSDTESVRIADHRDGRRSQVHPVQRGRRRVERKPHQRLDRRDVADQQHGPAGVLTQDPVAGLLHPARCRLQRLTGRWRHRGVGQPAVELGRPLLPHLVEGVAVPVAEVGLDQAVLDGHRQTQPLRDQLRGLPGTQQR